MLHTGSLKHLKKKKKKKNLIGVLFNLASVWREGWFGGSCCHNRASYPECRYVFCDREEPMKTAKMSAMASPFKIPEAPAELEDDTPQHEETPGFLLLLCPQKHLLQLYSLSTDT